MKSQRLPPIVAHVIALVVGLAIGLTIRAVMWPSQKSPATAISKPSSLLTGRTASNKAHIHDLVAANGKRSIEDEVALQVGMVELEGHEFEAVARRFLQHDLEANELALDAFFAAWGEVAPKDALSMIEQFPRGYQRRARRSVMASWVVKDADGAFAYADRVPKIRTQFVLALYRDSHLWIALAEADPQQALARTSQITNPEERRAREDKIMGVMSYAEPHSALEWLAKHRVGEPQKEAIVRVLERWADAEPRKAFEHLASLNEDLQSREAYHSVGRGMKEELANELFEDAPDKYRNSFWAGVVEGQRSPAKAAELASRLTEGESRSKALYSIGGRWAMADPIAASEWVGSLPRSKSRDSAIISMGRQIVASDPEAGVSWFADMDYQGKSNPHLYNALFGWLRSDRSAASAWMEQQPAERVSPKLKERVLKEADGNVID